MIRKKKKYNKPRKMYDKIRIDEENKLVNQYGLKNKREIWKAGAEIDKIRNQAKKLITASEEEKQILFNKLKRLGLKIDKIADVLELEKEDWLKRRLQSIIIKNNSMKPKGARQTITHKHVRVDGKIINIPGYIVKVDEEDKIEILKKKNKPLMGVKNE